MPSQGRVGAGSLRGDAQGRSDESRNRSYPFCGRAVLAVKYGAAIALLAAALCSCAARDAAAPAPVGAEPAPAPAPAAPPGPPISAASTSAVEREPHAPPAPTPAADATAAVPAIGSAPSSVTVAPPERGARSARGVQGMVGKHDAYSVWLEVAGPVRAGQSAYARVVLVAKPPYHPNPDYPYRFQLDPPSPPLGFREPVARGMEINGARGVLRIPFSASAPGTVRISGTLAFSVCNDDRCLLERRWLVVDVPVE
jgi:hypothetical protein